MSNIISTSKDVIGKFLGKYMYSITFIWICGIIINNSNLNRFGAFSWHILDVGYFSSGLLFATIITLLLILAILIINSFKNNNDNKVDKWKIWLSIIIILLVIIVIIICWLGYLKSIPDYSLFILHIVLLFLYILILLMEISNLSETDNKNKINSIKLVKIINNKVEQLTNDEPKEIGSKIINKNKFEEITSILKLSRKIDNFNTTLKGKKNNESFLKLKEVWLVLIILLILAYIFGRTAYPLIPKSIGGGKPEIIQFFYDKNKEGIIDFNRTYDLLDETPDEYIVYDPIEEVVIIVPHDQDKHGALKFLKQHKNTCTISFAADLHLSSSEFEVQFQDTLCDTITEKNIIKKINLKKFNYLSNYWNSTNYNYYMLLGDILEAPETNETDFENKYNKLLGEFYSEYYGCLKNINKTNVILGNNDFRTINQLNKFRKTFNICKNKYNVIEWEKKITDSIYAISLFLPDKIMKIDSLDYNIIIDNIKKTLPSKLKYLYSKYRFIFILTHQGFVEDNHWSGQYRAEDKDDFKNNPKAYRQWKCMVKEIMNQLRKFDRDYNYEAKKYPDIIVISGHYHKGSVFRDLDGIDHILCPSFMEGGRDLKSFNHESYPVLDININNNNQNTINVVFKSLTKENEIKTTLYYN